MKKVISLFLVLAILVSAVVIAVTYNQSGEELVISKDSISHAVSPSLYGISLEDVNFACDGGLSSNLVCNNSFEYEEEPFYGWDIDAISYSVQNKESLNGNNPKYLSVTVDEYSSIFNKGYTEIYDYKTYSLNEKKKNTADMGFKKDEKYEFSAYFKNLNFTGEITVSLKARGNSQKYIFNINECNQWTKVIFQIESDVTADGGLLIEASGNGIFFIDFISLVPVNSHGFHSEEWKYASVRADLYDVLDGLSPKYIRFPSGRLSAGNSIKNLSDWKNTVGPTEERKQTCNPWCDDEGGRNCNNSNSLGYYEFFMLCEDLKAEPVPVVNAGISYQDSNGYDEKYESYQNGAMTEEEWQSYLDSVSLRPGTDEWETYIQSILDLIEFANGTSETEWGAVRLNSGHKDPFNVKYIAVGNENRGEVYWRNFGEIYNAVKEKYPDITVIASADGNEFKKTKSIYKENGERYTDIMLDEHYAGNSQLFGEAERYDTYERSDNKIMIGEWSPKSNGYGTVQTRNNIWSAIEQAAFLVDVERNSDVVKMISFSPLLAKLNAQCVDMNLVWFDSQGVCLTPDYYTQMIFANNLGTNYISTDLDITDKGIYQSVTVDTEEQVIYIKLVNSKQKNVDMTVDLQGFENVEKAYNQYMSEVFKSACNEFGERLHVAPAEQIYELDGSKLNFKLEGLSINVIRIPYGDNDGELYVLPETEIVTPFIHPAFKVIIPFAITLLIVITVLAVLLNKYSLKKREKTKPANGEK